MTFSGFVDQQSLAKPHNDLRCAEVLPRRLHLGSLRTLFFDAAATTRSMCRRWNGLDAGTDRELGLVLDGTDGDGQLAVTDVFVVSGDVPVESIDSRSNYRNARKLATDFSAFD